MRGFSVPRSSLLFLAVSVCLVADSLSLDSYSYRTNYEGDNDLLVVDENDKERRYEVEQHLGVTEMISERERKLDEIDRSHKLTQENAYKAARHLEEFFVAIHNELGKAHLKAREELTEKLQSEKKRIYNVRLRIQDEFDDLKMLEMKRLLRQFQDIPKFLFPSGREYYNDWSGVSTQPDPMGGIAVKSPWTLANQLGVLLENFIAGELERIRQCAVDVTLDIRTAELCLIIPHDGKQVSHGLKPQPQRSRNDLERFHPSACVLGNEGFRSRAFYYEVLVGDKTEWVLGVARKSVDRKRDVELTTENGYWAVSRTEDYGYLPHGGPAVRLSPARKVGVFVDYQWGHVSFYDVDNKSLIYAYDAQVFDEPLYPFFCPGLNEKGDNATPLVITPVI